MEENIDFQTTLDETSIRFMPKLYFSLLELFEKSNLKIAITDNITGGHLINNLNSNISTINKFFLGGIVLNQIKTHTKLLGLIIETIKQHGFHSQAVTYEMAKGTKKLFGCDIGIAVSGIFKNISDKFDTNNYATIFVCILLDKKKVEIIEV